MRLAGVLATMLLALAPAAAPQPKRTPPLAARIDRILASAPKASWGIKVVDLRTGATVYTRNEHQPFVPASNAKLFSTALALTRLGPDYRFKTVITAPDRPDSGGRVAELRLVGGGDPNLSGRAVPYQYKAEPGNPARYIEQFAEQLVEAGVRFVEGDIIGDASAYANEPFPEGWAVDDPLYDYGAPVSALFINDGAFRLRLSPTEDGQPPVLTTLPALESMLIHNRAVTGGTDKLRFARLPGLNEFTVSGSVTRDHEYDFAVDNPARMAAEALREALLERGVRVAGVARAEYLPAGGVPLVVHESQPLIEALTIINKDSVNLHAEIVLLETARVRAGAGTRAAALEELGAYLAEVGIASTEYTFEDGSGLSRKTLVTPSAVTSLLLFMYRSPHRDAWIATLPVGGEDGTLATRFGNSRKARLIRAKTGSLSHVNALAGYAGDRYAFSILVNNTITTAQVVRRAMDQLVLALVP